MKEYVENNKKIEDYDIRRLATKDNIIHQKIQLWTNDDGNEYAIRLLLDEDIKKDIVEFITSTNPNEIYTHPIAESDHIENLKHGWDYALRELIEIYKKELYQQDFREYKYLHPIKLIPFHKCTYCNTKFSNEEERKDHELNWHV
jgi:hypothetical protein